MSLKTKKIELLILVFLLEIFLTVTLLYLTANNIQMMSYLLFALAVFFIIVSLFTNIVIAILLSIGSIFIYGSYLLYQVLNDNGAILAVKENYIWLFLFPILSVTAGKLGEALEKIQEERRKIEQEFDSMVQVDPVTNFNSKNRFLLNLHQEMAKARRHKQSLSILIMQIQYYQELKSLYRKEEIDKVLAQIASYINEVMRIEDHKYVLEEGSFAIILPFTGIEGAKLVKSRLKAKLESVDINTKENSKPLNFNFKVGVKEYHHEECSNPIEFKNLAQMELEDDF